MSDKTKKELLQEISRLREQVFKLEEKNRSLKLAAEDKHDAKKFLDNIINTSVDGIIVSDEYGTVTMVNQAIEDMFGYSRQEIIGKNTLELRPPGKEYEQKGLEFITKLLEDGMIKGVERTWKKKDGGLIEIEINVALIKDSVGNITGSVGSIRDITKRKWAEKKLLEYQDQLRSLASQLTLSEENERRSFATYLHDHIGQTLFILKISLETITKSLRSPKSRRQVQGTIATIQQMISDTRSLTFELSPPILYQLGFEAALEWLFEQLHRRYGIMTTFHSDHTPKPMGDDVLIVLFRGVRELLVNVAKHAGTKRVTVSLRTEDGRVHLQVADRGSGFNADSYRSSRSQNKGFGLFSIRERLEYLDGSLTISSRLRHGTSVTLTAPLKGTMLRKESRQS